MTPRAPSSVSAYIVTVTPPSTQAVVFRPRLGRAGSDSGSRTASRAGVVDAERAAPSALRNTTSSNTTKAVTASSTPRRGSRAGAPGFRRGAERKAIRLRSVRGISARAVPNATRDNVTAWASTTRRISAGPRPPNCHSAYVRRWTRIANVTSTLSAPMTTMAFIAPKTIAWLRRPAASTVSVIPAAVETSPAQTSATTAVKTMTTNVEVQSRQARTTSARTRRVITGTPPRGSPAPRE